MRSTDRGATWSAPITVSKFLPGFVSDPDDGTPLRTGDIIPDLAAGPDGSLYMVWQDATLAPSRSAIAFSKSTDGGLTWSSPVRINTAPDTQAFTAAVEVLTDGTIGVTHYDLRFNTPDGGATLPTDYWFLHSHDGGATSGRNTGHRILVRHEESPLRSWPVRRRLRGSRRCWQQVHRRLLGHPWNRPGQRVRVPAGPLAAIAVAPPLTTAVIGRIGSDTSRSQAWRSTAGSDPRGRGRHKADPAPGCIRVRGRGEAPFPGVGQGRLPRGANRAPGGGGDAESVRAAPPLATPARSRRSGRTRCRRG